jgi:hypothetical protein
MSDKIDDFILVLHTTEAVSDVLAEYKISNLNKIGHKHR